MSSPASAAAFADLQNMQVWRAGELGSAAQQTVSSAYPSLDAALPGSGWPLGALVEVMQPQSGQHEWGLIAPVLAALQATSPNQLIVLLGAPWLPFGPALGARALNMRRFLSVHGKDAPALLWATREALQCADVSAVLSWLPDARSAHLRRLQIAAHAHGKLLFVFRPVRVQHESSPAPLRLLIEGQASDAGNLLVHVLKRRGPPLAHPLLIDTRPARLSSLLAASRDRARRKRQEWGEGLPPSLLPLIFPNVPQVSQPGSTEKEHSHALDRTSSLHH